MQVVKISKSQKNLRQGTIFSFKSIKFDDGGTNTLTFSQMYPKVRLKNISYAIVLSQTCDLVEEGTRTIKTPYVQVGLLEPAEVYFTEEFIEEFKKVVSRNTTELNLGADGKHRFLNEEKITLWIEEKLLKIFQNNNPFYYFITIKQGKTLRLFNVNLSKTFSLRGKHHKAMRNASKYQLKPFFENKLGWKLAEIYGRVGTPDYKAAEINKLSSILSKKVEKAVSEFKSGNKVSNDIFERVKKANGNGTLQERKDIFSIAVL